MCKERTQNNETLSYYKAIKVHRENRLVIIITSQYFRVQVYYTRLLS